MKFLRMQLGLAVGLLVLMGALVPSAQAVPTLDLSTAGASGFIGQAYFEQGGDGGSSGTGATNVFLRLANDGTERGYNTDKRPFEAGFDMKNDPSTRSLLLSEVPIVNKGGNDYREFRLDINQHSGAKALLSLDTVEIYMASAGDLSGYPSLGTKIFDLDGSADNWILLNADLTAGGGGGQDMVALIPNNLFVGGNYVYLYSEFGASENSAYPANDGFDEWSVRLATPPVTVPAPGALLLAALGSPLALRLRRRPRA